MAKSSKKSFVNPLDALGVEADEVDVAPRTARRRSRPVEPVEEPERDTPRSRRSSRFNAPTDNLSKRDVRRASTKRVMIGQYQRKTITLPPEQVDYIKELAEQEGVGILEFYRWMIDTALMLYEEGERPQVSYREVRGEAAKGHWSSQTR